MRGQPPSNMTPISNSIIPTCLGSATTTTLSFDLAASYMLALYLVCDAVHCRAKMVLEMRRWYTLVILEGHLQLHISDASIAPPAHT
jgi:hypothetical protein